MLEKIGHVSNPLTIIAIFAGFAEVSGTLVLPFISDSVQGTYIWFLMGFPTLLVFLFFFILYTKPKVLYAPSDYRSDKTFVDLYYREKIDDYEENKELLLADAVKESLENNSSDIVDSKKIEQIVDSVSDQVVNYNYLYNNNSNRINYYKESLSFETLIESILIGLNIKISIQEYDYAFDILSYKKDKKVIPIEVKFYRKNLSGNVAVKLLDKIRTVMARLNTDEFILIISSGISDENIKDLYSKHGIHIVVGDNAKVLVPQFKKIYGLV